MIRQMKKHRFWFQYIKDGDIEAHVEIETDDAGIAMNIFSIILGAMTPQRTISKYTRTIKRYIKSG